MLRNRKGFIGIDDAIVVCAVIAVGALAVWFAGPSASKSIHDIWSGNKNQAKQVYKLEESRTPFYQDEKGKFVPASKQDSRKEYRENVVATEPPLTWFQKYGWILIVFVILIIAFPAFGISIYTKAKANLAQLVTGIEQAKTQLPPASIAILESNLSKKMDLSVKAQVKKIKGQLVAKGTLPTAPAAPITPATPAS